MGLMIAEKRKNYLNLKQLNSTTEYTFSRDSRKIGCPFLLPERRNFLKLIIAEKQSVAQSIAAALGVKNKKDGYMEGGGYLISWCVGIFGADCPWNTHQ